MSAAIALPAVIAIAAASNTFLIITHLHAQTKKSASAQLAPFGRIYRAFYVKRL
jgi:hypothetical protein